MEFGAFLQSIIYLISSSLLYPAMLVLLAGFVVLILSAGSFLAVWAERSRHESPTPAEWSQIFNGRRTFERFKAAVLKELQDILDLPESTSKDIENLWLKTKRKAYKEIDHLRLLVRVGPSTGLICTLIPMSTGLAALSQGDMSRLSTDMVVAFTTTIVGLTIGVAAFVLHSIRARWVEADLDVLRLIIEGRVEARLEDLP
ncbi:MAG: MotA/TolQ/ExbB proton channel family protein [Deltaproteobacteria bacterium]|jgi:biopolymer transport protein ExbB/TolQ|nr:MotA/TolQ/ExbB proton channel family protein [Deltaproteobacteria bacterium]